MVWAYRKSTIVLKTPFVEKKYVSRDGSRAAATSKMECFVIIVNGFQPITIIIKCSILDVAAVLDSPLAKEVYFRIESFSHRVISRKKVILIEKNLCKYIFRLIFFPVIEQRNKNM